METPKESLKEGFGRRVRNLRESRGHTREYLSQYVELDPQSIYRIEKGLQWIAPEKLEQLVRFYAISPAALFTDDVVKIHPTPREALEILARYLDQAESHSPERRRGYLAVDRMSAAELRIFLEENGLIEG